MLLACRRLRAVLRAACGVARRKRLGAHFAQKSTPFNFQIKQTKKEGLCVLVSTLSHRKTE